MAFLTVGYCAIAAWAAVFRNAYGTETGWPTTLMLSPRSARRVSNAHSLRPGRDQRRQLVLDAGRDGAVGQCVDDPLDVALAQGERHPALGQPDREVLAVNDDSPGLAGGKGRLCDRPGGRLRGGLGRGVRGGLDRRRGRRVVVGVAAGVAGAGVMATRDGTAFATWPAAPLDGAGDGVDAVQPASRSARPRARRLAGGRAAIEAPVGAAVGARDVAAGPRLRERARSPSRASMRRWSRSVSPAGYRGARPPRRRAGTSDGPDAFSGPVAEPGPPDQQLHGHRAVAARVDRRRRSPAAASASSVASRQQPRLVVGELQVALGERHAVAGPAATRLIASTPESGSRKTTTEPRRGQRPIVGSTSSQSPGSIAGSIDASTTATRHGPRRSTAAAGRRGPVAGRGLGIAHRRSRSAGPAGDPRLLLAAGRLPGGVDLVDQVEQLLGVGEVGRGLDLRDLLGRVPEQLVEVRDLLEVLGLEVVVPQDVEVVLDQVGPLLLDRDRAGPERRVLVGRVLLDDPVAGLGLDPGLLGVVDAARQVAVGAGDRRSGRAAGKARTSGDLRGSGAVLPPSSGRWMAPSSKCPVAGWACQTMTRSAVQPRPRSIGPVGYHSRR